jgi:hypothetical protein
MNGQIDFIVSVDNVYDNSDLIEENMEQQQKMTSSSGYIEIEYSICGHCGINLEVCENCDLVFPEEPAHVEIFGATEQLKAPAIPDFRYAYTTLKFCVVLETFFFFK